MMGMLYSWDGKKYGGLEEMGGCCMVGMEKMWGFGGKGGMLYNWGMEKSMESGRVTGGRNDASPIMVAAGGALIGAGMGFGVPGAIVGGLIGLWAGCESQKDDQNRGHRGRDG